MRDFFKPQRMMPIEAVCPTCKAGRKWRTTPGSHCEDCNDEPSLAIPICELDGVIPEERIWVRNYNDPDYGIFYSGTDKVRSHG